MDPGVVTDPRSLQHAEHRAHGVGVEDHRSGQPGPLGEHLHVRRRRPVGRNDQLDEAGAGSGRRVEHRRARLRQRAGEGPDGAVRQPRGDGSRLRVAVQHGVDDVVDGTGADGVVSRVAHHLEPGQLQQAVGVVRRGLEQRGQGLGASLQLSFGHRAAALDVHAVRGDAHEHVGPSARAQLALHAGQSLGGRAGQVAGERGDLEIEVVLQVVGLGHHPPEPGLGHQVVGPVHAQQVAQQEFGHLGHVVAGATNERLGVIGQRGTVAVADRQVLGPDRGAVGGLPDEGVLGHLRGHAPPDHGVVEAGQVEDLGHLGDVAEHVRQVAQLHHPAEGGPAAEAHLQVAHDRLTRGEEFVHQDVPGPHAHPAGGGQRPQPPLGLRADLEVVVDDGHLPVQHEVGVAGVALEEGEQRVDQLHQGEAEVLVGLVPFPVPVRVRNDGNPTGGHDRQTMTCGRRR